MALPPEPDHRARPTDVVLAVDAAFARPEDPFLPVGDRLVSCPVDGRSEGLSFLLDLLGWYELTATFFVETAQMRRFGDGPMGRAAERIHESEQELQLLIDPRWTDTGGAGSYDALIAEGLAAMDRWGVPPPTAVRRIDGAGDAALCDAGAAAGLRLTCSGRAGASAADGAAADGGPAGGPRSLGAATDLPLLTYAERGLRRRARRRVLSAAGVSWAEMRALLRGARRAGIAPVVIGLRTWDFVTSRDPGYRALRVDRGAQARLERLGEFLEENAGEFRSVGLGTRPDADAAGLHQ
jgi:hypothetical protein